MNQTRFWVTAATGGSCFNPLPKLEGEGKGGAIIIIMQRRGGEAAARPRGSRR